MPPAYLKLMKNSTILLFFLALLPGFLTAQTVATDAAMYKLNLPNYTEYQNVRINGVFRNTGTDTLKSVVVNWTVNGGPVQRLGFDTLKVARNQNWPFFSSGDLVLDADGDWIIKAWVSSPNGKTDEKASNDTLTHTIQVVKAYPAKNILIEEVTGAWCGFCPRAPIIYKKSVAPVYPNTIFVAIHTGDGMAIADSRDFTNTYVTGVPCGFVDRRKMPDGTKIDFSPEEWLNTLNHTENRFNPAILNVYNYYDPATSEWKIDVVADFIFNMSADFRLNAYIVEDSLIGSGSNWDQRNFFNGGANDPYRELQGAGDPLPGYYHNHVVRKMLGGSFGQAGIIPSQIKRGDRYVFSKTFKADSKWKMNQVHIVGLLQLYNSDKLGRQIINSVKTGVSLKTGTGPAENPSSVTLYPNPAGETAWLQIQGFRPGKMEVKIYSISGQEMVTKTLENNAADQKTPLDLSACTPGVYFVQISDGEKLQTIKLIRQ